MARARLTVVVVKFLDSRFSQSAASSTVESVMRLSASNMPTWYKSNKGPHGLDVSITNLFLIVVADRAYLCDRHTRSRLAEETDDIRPVHFAVTVA